MSWHRFEIQVRLEGGVTERRVDGSALQLGDGPLDRCGSGRGQRRAGAAGGARAAGGQSYLGRPARDLALCLLELAELAERRSKARDERT
jgi:hypothetical protein